MKSKLSDERIKELDELLDTGKILLSINGDYGATSDLLKALQELLKLRQEIIQKKEFIFNLKEQIKEYEMADR